MLTRPPWVQISDADRVHLRFIWDDTRALKDFTSDAGDVVGASMKMSLRARMVLCMGLYEWTLWRFDGLHSRPEPKQIAEAGWCASVDPRYLKFFELDRTEWLGSIEGPLWCAAAWLQPAMSQGHLFPRGVYDAVSFLTRLARHVLPDRQPFDGWLQAILPRLIETHPVVPDDPFADVMNRRVGERLGPLIGRDVLDPRRRYDPELGKGFLAEVLRDASASRNPFLATPADLKDLGFRGAPYVLPRESAELP